MEQGTDPCVLIKKVRTEMTLLHPFGSEASETKSYGKKLDFSTKSRDVAPKGSILTGCFSGALSPRYSKE